MTDFIAPRIRFCPDPAAPAVSSAVDDALAVLAESRRVVRAGADAYADIVHSIGATDPPEPTGVRVHTIGTVPLQPGHLAASRAWVRNQRRRLRNTTLLVHGVTAARLVLDTELAPRGQVYCLPLLVPDAGLPDGEPRESVRDGLGITPGAHLVLGYDNATEYATGAGWHRRLQAAGGRSVAVVRIHAPNGPRWEAQAVSVVGPQGPARLPLVALLAACDLFVTADRNLQAISFAVAALERGVPVVATTTDTAAELVLARGCGIVVPLTPDAVARAALSQLNDGRRRPAFVPAPGPRRQIAGLARALLISYRQVLRRELVGGAA